MSKLLRLAAALTTTSLMVTGCSSSLTTEWSVPLDLGDAYATTNVLSIAEADGVVVVPIANTVHGFDTETNDLAWSVTLANDVTQCTAAGANVLCSTGTQTAVAFDSAGNSTELEGVTVEGHTMAEIDTEGEPGDDSRGQSQAVDSIYFAVAHLDRVDLIEADASGARADIPDGDVIATFDGRHSKLPDGTRIERSSGAFPDNIQVLVDHEVLLQNSPWLNPPAIAQISQPLLDGFVIVDGGSISVSEVQPTTVTIFDLDGSETDKIEVGPSLHMSINPRWSQETMGDIARRAAKLGTDHAFVWESGDVIGFDRLYSDSVAPAFADVVGFSLDTGERLAFDPVSPESMGLWVVDYPYVSVFGPGRDGQVSSTFDVTSGKRVMDGAKCQWTDGATYCFTAEKLEKIIKF